MVELVLGPLLRYADHTTATVWVETSAPTQVTVVTGEPAPPDAHPGRIRHVPATGTRHVASTFHVEGHHYALVTLGDLEPASVTPYAVELDGTRVWPANGEQLPSVIRTRTTDRTRLAFGSCRAAAPHQRPWTLERRDDDRGRGADALVAYGRRLQHTSCDRWPDLLLMLGDQVYADDASPRTRQAVRARRDTSRPPGEQVADLEEYTLLYREAWADPEVRWLLSTVPTAMIFDDHDIIDDWNISASWLEQQRATSWWEQRIVGGMVSYWVHQHLGNVAPADLASDELWAQVQAADDAGPLLREVAHHADRDSSTFRWSYRRDLAHATLLVVDSRAGRVLGPATGGRTRAGLGRDMLDEAEWAWLEQQVRETVRAPRGSDGEGRHLLLASSLPVLLPRGVHDTEAWSEAVCAGAWGGAAAWAGERLRRLVDLEHWAAFQGSFRRLVGLLTEVGAGSDGVPPPDSIQLLSGDVHNGYVSRVRAEGLVAPTWQLVSSPMRQSPEPLLTAAYRLARGPAGRLVGRTLARLASVPDVALDWDITAGPVFDNHVATLELEGRRAHVTVEALDASAGDGRRLRPVISEQLA